MKFNIESPLLHFFQTLSEFIILNIVFLITCLPVITIGCAVTSLYQVTLREANNEHGYLIRGYLRGCKENFKLSTLAFLLYLLLGFIFIFNMFFWASYGGVIGAVVLLPITAAALILLIIMLYTFPLLARFNNSLLETLKNAYPLAMAHRKTTLLLLGFHGLVVFLFFWLPAARILMVMIGFSFFSYCCSHLLIGIFREYEQEENALHTIPNT